MILLDPRHLETVRRILSEHVPDCEARAFGSRVTGTAESFADLDIALVCDEALDWRRIEALKDAFAESDLPIVVDVLDWHSISDSFRAIIFKDCEVIQEPG